MRKKSYTEIKTRNKVEKNQDNVMIIPLVIQHRIATLTM